MSDLELTFSYDEDCLGQIVVHDLVPGGRYLTVTNDLKYAQYRIFGSHKKWPQNVYSFGMVSILKNSAKIKLLPTLTRATLTFSHECITSVAILLCWTLKLRCLPNCVEKCDSNGRACGSWTRPSVLQANVLPPSHKSWSSQTVILRFVE